MRKEERASLKIEVPAFEIEEESKRKKGKKKIQEKIIPVAAFKIKYPSNRHYRYSLITLSWQQLFTNT